MMATTHVFVGLLIAGVVAFVSPPLAGVAALGAVVGSLTPDFDVLATHRKTLHYPVYAWIPASLAGTAAIAITTPITVFLAVFFVSAAVHSTSDVIGGSHELKPWDGTVDRAVYSHYHDQWLPARRWISYDGSPGDLALAGLLAIPLLFVFGEVVSSLVVAMLVVSISYALLRRPIATVVGRLKKTLYAPLEDVDSQSTRPTDSTHSRDRE